MSPDIRIGTGVDVHAYDAGAPLRLAGLDWPGEPGLSGHSDGDVVCHAIVDALLSAAGPVNVSVQLVAVRPKFAPRRAEAEARLTALVGAPVSLGATTSDGLGFTGRGEGIAAIATALIARV